MSKLLIHLEKLSVYWVIIRFNALIDYPIKFYALQLKNILEN